MQAVLEQRVEAPAEHPVETEAHLYDFVVWPIADRVAGQLEAELAERFELLGVHRLKWSPARFADNLDRFYGYRVSIRDKTVSKHPGWPQL